jgi:hypothetical protein
MRCASNCLDKETAMRLLSHGVFLSTKVPPITKEQGRMLLAEAMLDRFVTEFKSLVREVLSGCQLSDFQATPMEIGGWFGAGRQTVNEKGHVAEQEGPQDNGGTPSYSTMCKEVDEKMQFDMQSKLDEYLRLLEQIKQKTTDERTAVSLLQEVSKDRRSAEIREERETKKSEGKKGEAKNNEPATEKQKQFMKKLGIEYPADVTKQYASMLIDEKREQNGE